MKLPLAYTEHISTYFYKREEIYYKLQKSINIEETELSINFDILNYCVGDINKNHAKCKAPIKWDTYK